MGSNQITETQSITALSPEEDTFSYIGSRPTSVQFACEYDKDYPYVGDNVDIRVTFTTNKNYSSLVTFYVKLFQYIDGAYQEIYDITVAAPPGSYDGTFTYSDIYFEPGQKQFLIQIFDSSGTTSLYTTGFNDLFIVGRWSITVDLPENRQTLGYLTMYDPYGISCCSDICLGNSIDNTDPSIWHGNTPTGVYTGCLGGPYTPTVSYGEHKVIELTGVSGEIMDCTARSGIWIHGGRDGVSNPTDPYYPLYPTYGCIRIRTAFQQTLEDTITELICTFEYLSQEGDVIVTEYTTVTIPSNE